MHVRAKEQSTPEVAVSAVADAEAASTAADGAAPEAAAMSAPLKRPAEAALEGAPLRRQRVEALFQETPNSMDMQDGGACLSEEKISDLIKASQQEMGEKGARDTD